MTTQEATHRAPRVLVLMGGPDAEREVSLASGRAVAAALRSIRHDDPDGLVVDRTIDRPTELQLRTIVEETRAEVLVPILHGPWGEGGPLQEMLERIGVPFVGSGSNAARLAMDKVATKTAAQQVGVQTPPARVIEGGARCDLAPPVVVKPIDDGSSVGVYVCHTVAEIDAARAALVGRQRLLAERFVRGREITIGMVLGQLLPPIEIRPKSGLYDYEAKYLRDDTEYLVDCPLETSLAAALRGSAERIIARLGVRDLARVDFIVDADGPWLLEVNTIPGFTDHSLVPMAAAAAGLEMPQLCAALVERAFLRGRRANARREPNAPTSAIVSPPS